MQFPQLTEAIQSPNSLTFIKCPNHQVAICGKDIFHPFPWRGSVTEGYGSWGRRAKEVCGDPQLEAKECSGERAVLTVTSDSRLALTETAIMQGKGMCTCQGVLQNVRNTIITIISSSYILNRHCCSVKCLSSLVQLWSQFPRRVGT